jgi:hypothetical protein
VGSHGLQIGTTQSSFANIPYIGAQTITYSSNTWIGVPFSLAAPLAISYVRYPVSCGVGASTTMATVANTSYSAYQQQTLYAMIYSMGQGNNSQSLQYIASSWVGMTQSFSISHDPTNGSYYTWWNGMTLPTLRGTSQTQWAETQQLSVTNIAISESYSSALTGVKYLDVPLVTTLTQGDYWLFIGRSGTTNTNYANASRFLSITNAFSHFGVSQVSNLGFGLFGQTSNKSIFYNVIMATSNVQGTFASFNMANISTFASHIIPNFEFRRET